MNIIVIGPVGSGKSTQSRLIADEFGIPLFNAGDLLYFKSLEPSGEGKVIAKTMASGKLVEDHKVLNLVEGHLKETGYESGFVIDGFPRSLWQAQHFTIPVDRVIYLVVSDKVNKERLLKRGRRDDTSEVIDQRLVLYHRETEPILDFYRKKGILIEIDGERPIDVIFKEIKKKVKA